MTLATLSREIMKHEAQNGALFKKMIIRLIPRPIENKSMHALYANLLTM